MIDVAALKEEHQRCYAVRIRNTVATAFACLTAGSLATWLVASALPLLGLLIGILALLVTILLTMLVYVLCEPPSHDLEEFGEIIQAKNYIR